MTCLCSIKYLNLTNTHLATSPPRHLAASPPGCEGYTPHFVGFSYCSTIRHETLITDKIQANFSICFSNERSNNMQ